MVNMTQEHYTFNKLWENSKVLKYTWISGIILSAACLILQLLLFKFLPRIRKMDLKVLTQLTVARLTYTILEFIIMCRLYHTWPEEYAVFGLFVYSDAIIVCWVIVFTKTLYDKVVKVFTFKKSKFVLLSAMIWTLTIPVGVLYLVACAFKYGHLYLRWYRRLKNVAMIANLISFAKIFQVIWNKKKEANSNFSSLIVTWIMSLILVCITNFGAFFRIAWLDFKLFDVESVHSVLYGFCVTVFIWDSLQGIPITVIFLILVKNSKRDM